MRTSISIATVLLSLAPAFAQAPAGEPQFEVASIKRNVSGDRPWLVPPAGGRFTATNITLKLLIGVGWPQKLVGGPAWVTTDGYDVSAKEPDRNVSKSEFSSMMRNLLKDRFRLSVHTETQDSSVYALTAAKKGLKLPGAIPFPCITGRKAEDPTAGCGAMGVTAESISNEKISMEWFAGVLEGVLGRPVVNKTGFTGSFKVRLEFSPVSPGDGADSVKPSLFSALEQQLGLKLESQKGTQEVLVIDHVERPSAN